MALTSNPQLSIALALESLAVERGGRIVASGLSFALAPGDALVLRGNNGTGKTSALRAIAGFARAPMGAVRATDADSDTPLDLADVRANHMHWLGGDDGLADRLTIGETLRYWQGLFPSGHRSTEDILRDVGLAGRIAQQAGRLSTGQRRRLGLVRLLLSPRAIWLLDEPLSGLDDDARGRLMDAVARHRDQGGIVIMATHEAGLPDAPTLRLSREVVDAA